MGRSQLIAKYEITEEIKELQHLAQAVKGFGTEVNIDITQDLVTINGFRKMTRAEAKTEMLRLIESNKTALGTIDFPDPEEEARKAKEEAKRLKKHREPGAPPEFKALIRRAKRIYKKSIIKGLTSTDASLKAQKYIHNRGTDEDQGPAGQALLDYIAKEMAS